MHISVFKKTKFGSFPPLTVTNKLRPPPMYVRHKAQIVSYTLSTHIYSIEFVYETGNVYASQAP
jgi:hypothetical protein